MKPKYTRALDILNRCHENSESQIMKAMAILCELEEEHSEESIEIGDFTYTYHFLKEMLNDLIKLNPYTDN